MRRGVGRRRRARKRRRGRRGKRSERKRFEGDTSQTRGRITHTKANKIRYNKSVTGHHSYAGVMLFFVVVTSRSRREVSKRRYVVGEKATCRRVKGFEVPFGLYFQKNTIETLTKMTQVSGLPFISGWCHALVNYQ